jgi:hypothetical protein
MIGVAASGGTLAHGPAQAEARLIRQHEVDEDQVGRILERRTQRVARRRGLAARDLPVRETFADFGTDIAVFVYDQDHFGRHDPLRALAISRFVHTIKRRWRLREGRGTFWRAIGVGRPRDAAVGAGGPPPRSARPFARAAVRLPVGDGGVWTREPRLRASYCRRAVSFGEERGE